MKRAALISTLSWMLGLVLVLSSDAEAVPSYSRQTGLECVVCHSNPPELTGFGRRFKLNGYTLTDMKPDTSIGAGNLKINRYFPLSVMFIADVTAANKRVPGAQNGNAQFPQTLSAFLAGEIAPHLGGQVQVTYSHQSDHFTLDNTDIRYGNHGKLGGKDVSYGLTLNNNPTVEDLWNSTPAWGYPWIAPNSTPGPNAKPVLAGSLAQDVAGLGVYGMWNDHLYAGLTLYRSEHAGGPQPATGTNFAFNVQGVAPYWRLAWQQTWGLNYLEIGTYGMYLRTVPGASTGLRDTYFDRCLDLQYERPFGVNLLTLHATYLHEKADLDATFAAGSAAMSSHQLDTVRVDATYHVRSRYTFTLAGFSTTGSSDAALYAQAPITGSGTGSPATSGVIVQGGYWPSQNVEISVQYTGYTKFNGASRDYDGAGRNASDNNATYVAVWLSF
jgi:hypothetical protein